MTTATDTHQHTPIACDIAAVSSDQMAVWMAEIVPELYSAVEEISELDDGFAWKLPASARILTLLATDLDIERRCCPFVRYTLEIEPDGGPFWLRMTGRPGVKEFLRIAFEASDVFHPDVAAAAGFDRAGATPIESLETAVEVVGRINELAAAQPTS